MAASKPPIAAPNGKAYKTVHVDGQDTRPQDAYWVLYSPDGKPFKAFTSDVHMADNRLRAMRSACYGDSNALEMALDGYRIELMGSKRFLKTIAANLPDSE